MATSTSFHELLGVDVGQLDPDTEFDFLASQLGELLIEQVVPEEIELYPELIESHRSSTKIASRKVDHPLAFGVGELAAALSPLIYEVAKVVIRFLIEEINEVLKKTAEDIAKQKILDWIHRRLSGPPPVELSSEKVNTFMATLRDELKESKITEDEENRILASVDSMLKHRQNLTE